MILGVIALAFCLPYAVVLLAVVLTRTGRLILGQLRGVLRKSARVHTLEASPKNPAAIVTLVHGTFAPFADWTQHGSALRNAIETHVQGPVAFRNLIWSGRNTVAGRQAAADQLSDMLETSCANTPDIPHVVVAHSHGGNIAMTALSRSETLRERCGLVCLSTPFLVMRPREMSLGAGIYQILFPILLGFMALYVFRSFDLIPWSAKTGGETFGVLAFAAGFHWLSYKMVRRIQQHYVQPKIPPRNALLLRTLADEATIGIAAANLFGKAMHGLINRPLYVLEQAGFDLEAFRARHQSKGSILFAMGCAVLALVYVIRPDELRGAELPLLHQGLMILAGILFGFAGFLFVHGTGVLAVLLSGVAVLAFPVVALVFFLSLAAGREMALAGAYLEMAAESSPPGQWDVVLVPEPHERTDGDQPYAPKAPSGLQHAQSYVNPQALAIMGAWIEQWCSAQNSKPD